MILPSKILVFNMIRDVYEAYVLYVFMNLLVHFVGGENQLIIHLEFKRRIQWPWPFHRRKPMRTNR